MKFEIPAIGFARTPWTRRQDAPHQPSASPDALGTIEILEEYRAGLADLASFSRIWVVFYFDRSGGWGLKVRPPRGGPKRGIFATRAPDRPSPLGLTNVSMQAVDLESGTVSVQGIDLLDGTPVLDLKPYLPFVDAWPEAGHGWLQEYLDRQIEPRLKKPYRPPKPSSR